MFDLKLLNNKEKINQAINYCQKKSKNHQVQHIKRYLAIRIINFRIFYLIDLFDCQSYQDWRNYKSNVVTPNNYLLLSAVRNKVK